MNLMNKYNIKKVFIFLMAMMAMSYGTIALALVQARTGGGGGGGGTTSGAPTPTDSTSVVVPSSITPACATTYTAYLSSDATSWWTSTYSDPNYGSNPPTSFYLTAMPAAGVSVPPYGLPLCAGTYTVTMSLAINTGNCGHNNCNFNMELYAGSLTLGTTNIIFSDGGLGTIAANSSVVINTQTGLVISTSWKTSQGPLYPPLFRGQGSDYGYLVPGKNSWVTVTWTGP